MRPVRPKYGPGLIAMLVVAACSESPAQPEDEAPDTELVGAFMTALGSPSGPGAFPCPAGGEREAEFDANVMTTDTEISVAWSADIEFRGCAIPIEGGTLTTDGELRIEGTERRERFDDVHMGRLLERSSRQTGSLRWRTGQLDRTCTIDLTQTFDVSTSLTRVLGTICGDAVDFTFGLPGA